MDEGLPYEQPLLEALGMWTDLIEEFSGGGLMQRVEEFDALTIPQRTLLINTKGVRWYLKQAREIEEIRRLLHAGSQTV